MLDYLLIGVIMFFSVVLVYSVFRACKESPSKQQGGKYLIAYSYSKEVRGGQAVSGAGNYLTDNAVTDFETMKKMKEEIVKEFGLKGANVVILNIMVL